MSQVILATFGMACHSYYLGQDKDPKNAVNMGGDAVVMIRRGELKTGGELLREALDLAAPNYCRPKWARTQRPSRLDMLHGDVQLRAMRKDRPRLAEIGKPGDALWLWTTEAFAGKTCGTLVEWDSRSPVGKASAHYLMPARGIPARIRVGNVDNELKFASEKMWAELIFELHNLAYYTDIQRICERALKGEISSREFVKGVFLIEYRAVQDTRQFYARFYLPYAARTGLSTDPDLWFMHECWWKEGNSAFAEFDDWSEYPWVPYKWYYWQLRFRQLQSVLTKVGSAQEP
jgi:hypothetical protein